MQLRTSCRAIWALYTALAHALRDGQRRVLRAAHVVRQGSSPTTGIAQYGRRFQLGMGAFGCVKEQLNEHAAQPQKTVARQTRKGVHATGDMPGTLPSRRTGTGIYAARDLIDSPNTTNHPPDASIA